MFNLKKIEPKFPQLNSNQLKRKTSSRTINNNELCYLDIDISETDNETLDNEKYRTIEVEENKIIKENLIKKNQIGLKQRLNNKNNKYKIINDNYSITTNCSEFNFKGIKKVTFSTVEIIRVTKYKKFNAKNNFSKLNIQKNIIEVKANKNRNESSCNIF